MTEPCRWVTWHFLRFPDIRTPDMLDLSRRPAGATGWEIGPDGPPKADGTRELSPVWCAVGLFPHRLDAEAAVAEPAAFLPFLAETEEAWHALLMPVAHRGECNHLDREVPGRIVEPHGEDPGGPLVVMTTGGFVLGPDFDKQRAFDFTHRSFAVRQTLDETIGNLARQIFYPHVFGVDPVTMTIWRDDAAMSAFAYRPGLHRDAVDRHKREGTLDRTSFTRLRAVRTHGNWEGRDPIAAALEAAAARPRA